MQTIGSEGRLLRFSAYYNPGTFFWYRQPDVGFIIVMGVGAGGGESSDGSNSVEHGTASSFGTHFTAGGGRAGGGGTQPSFGAGGTASGGDINIAGRTGVLYGSDAPGFIGGGYGRGSRSDSGRDGGSGGFCLKKITRSLILPSEQIVVGQAYIHTSGIYSNLARGINGAVIIYEYSL